MTINPEQIRAARAMLKWTQNELADRVKASVNSIKNIEAEATQARPAMLDKIKHAFDTAGIEFLPRSGVKIKTDKIRVFDNGVGYTAFFHEILEAVDFRGAESLVTGVDEAIFQHKLPGWEDVYYLRRMNEIFQDRGKQAVKAIICDGDNNEFGLNYAEYRSVPKEAFPSVTSYVFENKVGIVLWKDPTKIVVIEDEDIADAYRIQFYMQWNMGKQINKTYRQSRSQKPLTQR